MDDLNPRLREEGKHPTQDELLRVLWRDFAVDEIALSIAANGFFAYEPLFVEEKAQRYVVIEGNRRLAAVRLLLDPAARTKVGATDLPKLTSKELEALRTLPAVVCERSQIWPYVAFKHVNGPQAWESYSKAQYIAWVFNELKVPLDEIAKQIGDEHSTVVRLYGALMALEQVERAGLFRRDDRWKVHFSFSHLYTGLRYPGIARFVGVSPLNDSDRSPIPRSKVSAFAELCEWLFGSKSKNKRPLVESQNPDLRNLDEVLLSKDGVAALRRGLPLGVAVDISKGDERLFRESVVAAKRDLQEARGKLLTGYRGEADLLQTADEVVELATNVRKEMLDVSGRRLKGAALRRKVLER